MALATWRCEFRDRELDKWGLSGFRAQGCALSALKDEQNWGRTLSVSISHIFYLWTDHFPAEWWFHPLEAAIFYVHILHQELGRDFGPLVATSLNSVIIQPSMADKFQTFSPVRAVPHWLKQSWGEELGETRWSQASKFKPSRSYKANYEKCPVASSAKGRFLILSNSPTCCTSEEIKSK